MARWLSWLERRPVTAEVDGSNPFRVACIFGYITTYMQFWVLAQLGEHLPYKQRVTGSSPVGPICISAGVVEQADTRDLKSLGLIIRAGSNPATRIFLCGYGGIGRRARFRFWWKYRAGSSPVTRIRAPDSWKSLESGALSFYNRCNSD